VQFANENLNAVPNFWDDVIFSDEKVFQSSYSGQLRVYHPRGERFEEPYLQLTDRSGRLSVHIWGWISSPNNFSSTK